MRILIALFLFASVLPCSAMLSVGYLTKETAKKRGVELNWKPAGSKLVWVEMSIDTTGDLKPFAKAQRGNRIDLRISRGEDDAPVIRTAMKEDRETAGKLKVSFTVLRSELHEVSLWITQYVAGIAYVVRMEDFIALDKIEAPVKADPASKSEKSKGGGAPAAAVERPATD